MHVRNRHQGNYDFPALIQALPELAAFAEPSLRGCLSLAMSGTEEMSLAMSGTEEMSLAMSGTEIMSRAVSAPEIMRLDFADPNAVMALNRALLRAQYRVQHWQLPEGFLCAAVPGRADYVHGLADLLAADLGIDLAKQPLPRFKHWRTLDIGVGANCIYPLLGQAEYGWRFVGSECEAVALTHAQQIVHANGLEADIQLRSQPNRGQIFKGVIQAQDQFALTMCNPPFHASEKEALQSRQRKWSGLNKSRESGTADKSRDSGTADKSRESVTANTPRAAKQIEPTLNFGGQSSELWCTGGEASFVKRMVRESAEFAQQVLWYSTLVSRSEHLPELYKQLRKAQALEVRTVAMAQGAKQSRFVAWSFHSAEHRTKLLRSDACRP